MRRVRDVIRMKAAGLPSREIARREGAAPSTVRLAIRRFEAAGLTWPLPDDVTDTVLELRLFAKTGNGNRQGHRRIAEPDWATVHRELKRKHGRCRSCGRSISPPSLADIGTRVMLRPDLCCRCWSEPWISPTSLARSAT
ncbi:hypothetical protein ACVI1L_004899 [Bradyrhizobium sp. USDA 4516]